MVYKAIFSNFFLLMLITAGTPLMAENKKLCDEIIIGFSKDASKADIEALQSKFKLKAVKKFKRIYAICYKLEDAKKMEALIKKLQQENIVRYAERNGKVAKKS